MRIVETKVFQYTELSDKAKEKARDWYREAGIHDEWWWAVYDDAEECAKLIGIDFDVRPGRGMAIFFSGFSSQGDGACFEGTWRATSVKPGALKQHAPQDTELHRIAAEFERIAKEFPHSSFRVKHSGHYSHQYCTNFDVSITDNDDNEIDSAERDTAEKDLIEAARDFMQWIYNQLEKEHDYLNSDESVEQSVLANEYEFTEDGKPF